MEKGKTYGNRATCDKLLVKNKTRLDWLVTSWALPGAAGDDNLAGTIAYMGPFL